MTELPTRPFLAIYVVWHPAFAEGANLADALYKHFRREIFSNVAGGTGLSVAFRFEPLGVGFGPLEVNFESAETTAVVTLVDDALAGDSAWVAYMQATASAADAKGFGHQIFPVTFSESALRSKAVGKQQAIRWSDWANLAQTDKFTKLRTDLAHQFSKMLRHYLEHLLRPEKEDAELAQFLKPVRVFLSHSKHDEYGEGLARATRKYLYENTEFDAFFDVRNIPPGLHFDDVLEHYVRVSAVIAFHTDSFSTREWCRREILEAKRANVPLVVADAIVDFEERGFPYMGNVPVVRLDRRSARKRIPTIIAALLDEVLKDFLWKCRVALVSPGLQPSVAFLPRPPELLSLATLAAQDTAATVTRLVYPDPPIGAEEATLFEAVSPTVVLQSYTEWIGEFGA